MSINNLVKCNACGKDVSNIATTCPHCGNSELKKTELGKVENHSIFGVICLLTGIIGYIISFLSMYSAGAVVALILLAISTLFFQGGTSLIQGKRNGICPHCGKAIQFKAFSTNVQCPYCKNTSSISDNYLVAK